jgi:hypothetical protein
MNNDDESFLSAYIDGELNADQQQRLESALVQNPQLAEKLRGLTLVRDLVAGLPHDRSVDITARVMNQIHSRERGFLRALEGWRRGSRRILPLAGLAASAASLMVAASLAIVVQTSRFDRGGEPAAALPHGGVVAQSNPSRSAALSVVQVKPDAPASPASAANFEVAFIAGNGLAAASNVAPVASERGDLIEPGPGGDAEHARQLLDDPSLKRLFSVRNGPRNDSEQVVATIIEHTTRAEFFKMKVASGIAIGAQHPEEATVIAFIVNSNQLERFSDQLKDALPGLVEQRTLDPAVATQLADIDIVQSFPPASLAEVEIPRDGLALRTRSSGGTDKAHGEQEGATASKEAGRPETPADSEKVVLLVWIGTASAR